MSFTCLFKITIYINIAFVCLQLVLKVIIFGSNLDSYHQVSVCFLFCFVFRITNFGGITCIIMQIRLGPMMR